jgi:hypothetical protein
MVLLIVRTSLAEAVQGFGLAEPVAGVAVQVEGPLVAGGCGRVVPGQPVHRGELGENRGLQIAVADVTAERLSLPQGSSGGRVVPGPDVPFRRCPRARCPGAVSRMVDGNLCADGNQTGRGAHVTGRRSQGVISLKTTTAARLPACARALSRRLLGPGGSSMRCGVVWPVQHRHECLVT